jgi:hypothetical protein
VVKRGLGDVLLDREQASVARARFVRQLVFECALMASDLYLLRAHYSVDVLPTFPARRSPASALRMRPLGGKAGDGRSRR